MALDIYFVRDDTIISANHNFGGGSSMTGWTDATGSWSNGGDGVVYDGDSEFNPLTQDVTLAVGWHHISALGGGMSDGEYIVRVIRLADQQAAAEIRSSPATPESNALFEVSESGDYQIAISATADADGSVENVILTTTENRVPVAYDSRFSLNYDELVSNPTFYLDIGGWSDATGSWFGNDNLAVYDNDGEANLLHTSVTVPANGWYRLGIEAAAGASIAQLFCRVQGITPSIIEWHNGQRESFFYLTAGSHQVDLWTSGITSGGVKLVSLMAVDAITGKRTVSRTVTATVYLTPADELVLVDPTASDIYVNLPPLDLAANMQIAIKQIASAANSVYLDGDGSETVEGLSIYTMAGVDAAVTLVATPDGWVIISAV